MSKQPVTRNEPCELDKAIAKSLSNINSNMNFMGFTKRFVSNLESEAEKGLTDKQRKMAVLIMCRFRRQIPNFNMLLRFIPAELKKVASDYLKGKK